MAEFIRIWDDTIVNTDGSLGDYIEYDTTVVESETVYVPVSNISISRPINAGTVVKVIDTNDVIKRFQALEVAQIQKFITVEKSYENRFSIERSNAKSINIESKRSSLIVNTSGIGQRGEKGQKGDGAAEEFRPNRVYVKGSLAIYDGKLWESLSFMNGVTEGLSVPAENLSWSEVATAKYVEELNLLSGFKFDDQDGFDEISSQLELGDLIKPSKNITLNVTTTTDPLDVLGVGAPLRDIDGNEYSILSYLPYPNASADNLLVTFNFLEGTRSKEKFFDALRATIPGFKTGDDVVDSPFSPPESVINAAVSESTDVYAGDGTSFRIRSEFTNLAGFENRIRIYGTPELPVRSGNELGSIITTAINIGVRVEGTSEELEELVVDQFLVSTHLDGSIYSQKIIKISVINGDTYYELVNYQGFVEDDIVIRGIVISGQTLAGGLWYVFNADTDLDIDKFDILGVDPNNEPTLATDPGLISESQRLSISTNTNITNTVVSKLSGIQDGAQVNAINSIATDGVLNISSDGDKILSSIAEVNEIDSVESGGVLSISTDGNKVLSSTAEVNEIDGVTGLLSISSDNNKILSTSAEVNKIDTVDETAGSILDLDTNTESATYRQLSAIKASATGGSTTEAGQLILLNPDGFIPSTAITQVNLSSVTIFETTSERNASTDTAWSTGDTTIIPGVPNLSIGSTAFLDNGTTIVVIKLDDTEDSDGDFDPLPTSGDLNLLSNNNVFKRITYTYDASTDLATDTTVSDQVTFTHTLTVTEPFTGDDVTDFLDKPERTAVTTATGTFVYKSSSQTPGDTTATPPETVGQTTDGDDWAEIVPTGGVVTSINGSSGVVTLGVANVNGLEDRLEGGNGISGKVDKAANNRLGATTEFDQITTNTESIGEADRTATAEDIAAALAETPPRTIDSDTVITGSGLEKSIQNEITDRGTADTAIIGSVGTVDSEGNRSGNTGYLGGDATLQDSKQDSLTAGATTDQLLKWDGDSWEPGNVEFATYDSTRTYSRKQLATTGRVGLGNVIRLKINASHTGNNQQLDLRESTVAGRFLQIFGNFANNLTDADGNTNVSLAPGTPGVIPGSSGQIRVSPNQTPEATAADIALILPRSLLIRSITGFTVQYFGGDELYIIKSTDIGTLTTIPVGNPGTWDTTFDEFDDTGVGESLWFAKVGSTDVTPGTDNSVWGKLDNRDEVSEYDSTREYSAKELVTTGRVPLGDVILLRINTPQSGGGQQLDLRESTVGGRFIQIFSNDSPGDLSDDTGIISLAPGTPGAFAANGSIRISAGQTATAVASDLASILPYSLSVRNITGFTVHYFGDDTVYISKSSTIGTLTKQVQTGTWNVDWETHNETGVDINTFISLTDFNNATPGTNRSAWGKLNTVNDDGNLELLDEGAGIILTSPDGSMRRKITIDSDGDLVFETL